jgi:hypothetical protein
MRFWQNGALVNIDPGDVGAYDGGEDYVPGDLVSSGGVYYYCIANASGDAPPDTDFWYALPGTIYEIPSPFTVAAGTSSFKWVQSGRVITLTSRFFPTHDLVYQALTRWVLVELETKPKVLPPDNLAIAPLAGTRTFGYIVTAAAPGSYEESEPSAQAIDLAIDEPTEDAPHVLTWDAVLTPPTTGDPSPEYYVYCDPYANGTYGFIGVATGAATFNNPGIVPDFTRTPPQVNPMFATAEEYPDVCAYHKQRRFLANTIATPDAIHGSRIGFPDNYGISSPLQDDDAISARIAGNNDHAIQWMVALKDLLIMTDGGEWRLVTPAGVLTPSTIGFDQETYVGISHTVPPVAIGNSIVYVQARGSVVRDLTFDQQVEGLGGRDLTVFASHLFGRGAKQVVSMAYAQAPESIVWAVRADGTLLGLTYVREQEVYGWHRHDTVNGGWEQVAVVPGAEEDEVYLVARRTIAGATVRYLEKLESRDIQDLNVDGFFVDCGLSYSGAPVSNVSGLDHLEGQTVAMCGDGEDLGTAVVVSGGVALGGSYSNVHVGLPITADLETVDLDVQGSAIRDKKKRVQAVTVLLDASSRAFSIGENVNDLVAYRGPSYDGTDAEYTGMVETNVPAKFSDRGRVFIRQSAPLPITVLGVIPHVEVGG